MVCLGYLRVFAGCVLGILEVLGLDYIADVTGFCCVGVGLRNIGLCVISGCLAVAGVLLACDLVVLISGLGCCWVVVYVVPLF